LSPCRAASSAIDVPGARKHPAQYRIPSRIYHWPNVSGIATEVGGPIRGDRSQLATAELFPCDRRSRLPAGPQLAQWLADCGSVPGRELLICLIIVLAGAELHGGTESRAAEGESSGSLHPGPGQLRSSEEAGRADGARCETEDGEGRHGEEEVCGGGEETN
jgi:hypothetical protein